MQSNCEVSFELFLKSIDLLVDICCYIFVTCCFCTCFVGCCDGCRLFNVYIVNLNFLVFRSFLKDCCW